MKHAIKRTITVSLITTLIIAIIIVIGASYYMLGFALEPLKRSHNEAMERFFKREPSSIKTWTDSLEQYHALVDTSITIDNRGTLRAMIVNANKPSNKVAVLLHGYKDRAESMLHIAYLYHSMGFNVLLPHCFAHGESDGDHIDMGWLDRHDMMRWMQVANEKFRGDSAQTQMVVHGISMGGFTTMCISGEKCPSYVKCFVEDCGYTSVWNEFSHQLHSMFSLSDVPLLYTTSALCKMRYGWTFGEASAVEMLKKSRLPMLFIHGDADTFVPFSMLDELYNAKTQGYKEKYVAPGSEHAQSYTDHTREYTQRVKTFVTKFIK